jgi:hypothetical protein
MEGAKQMINFPASQNIPKERPRCRKVIIEAGLRPLVVNGKWDGRSSLYANGREAYISDGLRKQMKRMIVEGYWSETTTPADSNSGG